jgi:hypothetical protein
MKSESQYGRSMKPVKAGSAVYLPQNDEAPADCGGFAKQHRRRAAYFLCFLCFFFFAFGCGKFSVLATPA